MPLRWAAGQSSSSLSCLLFLCFIGMVFCQDNVLKAEEIETTEALFSTLDIVILVGVIGQDIFLYLPHLSPWNLTFNFCLNLLSSYAFFIVVFLLYLLLLHHIFSPISSYSSSSFPLFSFIYFILFLLYSFILKSSTQFLCT